MGKKENRKPAGKPTSSAAAAKDNKRNEKQNRKGDQNKHSELRAQVVNYIRTHKDVFEPFIEDEEPFDTYVARMGREGQWGGHLELQAASLVLASNIAVYQEDQPRWVVRNFPDDAPTLHLAYHGGEHYNSIRCADDHGPGPPQPINLADGATGVIHKPAGSWSHKDEEKVMERADCYDVLLIKRSLEAAGGKVDAAVELVLAQMHSTAAEPAGDGPGDAAGCAVEQEAQRDEHEDADFTLAYQLAIEEVEDGGKAEPWQETAQDTAQHHAGTATSNSSSHSLRDRIKSKIAASCGCVSSSMTDSTDLDSSAATSATTGSSSTQAASAVPSTAAMVTKHQVDEAGRDSGGPEALHRSPAKRLRPQVGIVGKKAGKGVAKVISRNKDCPCGSGRKYKNCCQVAELAAERRKAAAATEQADRQESAAAGAVTVQMSSLFI